MRNMQKYMENPWKISDSHVFYAKVDPAIIQSSLKLVRMFSKLAISWLKEAASWLESAEVGTWIT